MARAPRPRLRLRAGLLLRAADGHRRHARVPAARGTRPPLHRLTGCVPNPDATAPAVEVRDLVREFKGGIRAVDGLDLEVRDGEIYGFLGPNGAGKTTVVRILTTLLRPTSGRALVAGHDVVRDGDAVRRSIGVALQEAAIDPLMTGRELLRMQGALHGLRSAEARARAVQLLERVGLTEAADRRVGGYSGGMRRRLDLALALVHRPARAVPRRADHRARPQQPRGAVARGARAARRRHDRVPDHPVPRGGRAARRPRRHHRARQARGRGHAGVADGARGGADRARRARRPARARPPRAWRWRGSGPCSPRMRTRPRGSSCGPRPAGPRSAR